jgi:hypothetical protein
MPILVSGAFLLALLVGMLVSLMYVSVMTKVVLWFVLPLGLAAVISEWAVGWMAAEWRPWALTGAFALVAIGLITAVVLHYVEHDGLSIPVSAGVLGAGYLLTANFVDLGAGAWRPWAMGVAITLLGFGGLVDLFLVYEKYDAIGGSKGSIAVWTVIGLLGIGGLTAAGVADRGSWTPIVFVLSTLLLTTGIAQLPMALSGKPPTAEPVPPRQLTANALGGFAVVATSTVAIVAWHVPIWLGLLLAVPDILAAAFFLPPLVIAAVNRPRVRTKEAMIDAGTVSVVTAFGTYLVVLIVIGSLWTWLDFVLGALAVGCYLLALTMMSGTHSPSTTAAEGAAPEPALPPLPEPDSQPVLEVALPPKPQPDPEPVLPVFVPPAPVVPTLVSAELAIGGRLLVGRLDQLTSRPDRVYRLLLRAQGEVR